MWSATLAFQVLGVSDETLLHAPNTGLTATFILQLGVGQTMVKRYVQLFDTDLVAFAPDPSFPFLGVHFTKLIDGRVIAGPNAVLALAREQYGRAGFDLKDVASTLGYRGFWRLARQHFRFGAVEVWRDVVKRAYVRELQRYLPAVTEDDLDFGPSGIRAQALARDGALVDDFVLERTGRQLHVLNAPSPAATASLAIAEHIAGDAVDLLR